MPNGGIGVPNCGGVVPNGGGVPNSGSGPSKLNASRFISPGPSSMTSGCESNPVDGPKWNPPVSVLGGSEKPGGNGMKDGAECSSGVVERKSTKNGCSS